MCGTKKHVNRISEEKVNSPNHLNIYLSLENFTLLHNVPFTLIFLL